MNEQNKIFFINYKNYKHDLYVYIFYAQIYKREFLDISKTYAFTRVLSDFEERRAGCMFLED